MKKFMIITGLCLPGILFSMEQNITFPSAEAIEKQLALEKIPAHVSRQLRVPEEFGTKVMPLNEISLNIDHIFSEYTQAIQDPDRKEKVIAHLKEEKQKLFKALVAHDPEATQHFIHNDTFK